MEDLLNIIVGLLGVALIILHWIVWAAECTPPRYESENLCTKQWMYWTFYVIRLLFLICFCSQVITMLKSR